MYLDQILRFQCLYETESSQKDHTKITWHSQTTFRHKSYIESEWRKKSFIRNFLLFWKFQTIKSDITHIAITLNQNPFNLEHSGIKVITYKKISSADPIQKFEPIIFSTDSQDICMRSSIVCKSSWQEVFNYNKFFAIIMQKIST